MNKTRMILHVIERSPDIMISEIAKKLAPKGVSYRAIAVALYSCYHRQLITRSQPDNLYYRYRIK